MERGRAREGAGHWVRKDQGRFFHRSARRSTHGISPRFQHPPPRVVPPRGPTTTRDKCGRQPGGFQKRQGNDDRLGNEATRNGLRDPVPLKRSFRDLFSDQDVAEGGKWVEVRRKKVIHSARGRSPIIKNPCFRCGLGGHFRRNCPRRANMRCYGCNSQYHFLRDCPVIQRPAEVKVELQNVYDIEEKVESLSKFAIFRSKDQVNIHALREAMMQEFWEFRWQGKIFPIDKQSYLVGLSMKFAGTLRF